MKLSIIIIFLHLLKFNLYSQDLGKNELNFKIHPSVFTRDKSHVQYMKNENESKVKLLQVETVYSRLFSLKKNVSVQTGLGFHYQYYSFSNIMNGVKSYYGPDPGQFYQYFFVDKPTKIQHDLDLKFNLGINFKLKEIRNHTNYLQPNFSINFLKFQYSNFKTDDSENIAVSSLGYINVWEMNFNFTNTFEIGISYHYNIFKSEKEKRTFLILGLNYEIYNTPDIYDFRLFSSIGIAHQFGEFRNKKE